MDIDDVLEGWGIRVSVCRSPSPYIPTSFLMSDESGQCMEGDHAIALTQELRAVVLVGPKQLPPTVIFGTTSETRGGALRETLDAFNKG